MSLLETAAPLRALCLPAESTIVHATGDLQPQESEPYGPLHLVHPPLKAFRLRYLILALEKQTQISTMANRERFCAL